MGSKPKKKKKKARGRKTLKTDKKLCLIKNWQINKKKGSESGSNYKTKTQIYLFICLFVGLLVCFFAFPLRINHNKLNINLT